MPDVPSTIFSTLLVGASLDAPARPSKQRTVCRRDVAYSGRPFIAPITTAALLSATLDGLVNVYVNDAEIAKDIDAAAVVGLVAHVCALVDQTDKSQSMHQRAVVGPHHRAGARIEPIHLNVLRVGSFW